VSLIGKIEEAADEENWDGGNDHSMNASYMDRSKMEMSFNGGGGGLGGGRSRANLDVSINKLDVSRSKDKYLNVSKSK
jgi:hypothetical protein